ncbi:hypothetical protein ACCC92_03005 [Mucilaginibacter sp. Mucisp84]|uniref:alpha/beta hydrolase n=1 Tax=Mucilaginibacter sp. Mucisp84 TaxID=3243058 RepID=UPI0039A55DC4
MYHSPPVFLPEGKNSTAFYTSKEPSTLIVFVHGFTGVSVGTWNNFNSLIQADEDFAECDLLFYGYDSLNGQAFGQAQELLRVLKKYNKPSNELYARPKSSEYKKIILAAHSLGAIVSRQALLEAIRSNQKWRNKVKLMLFAPAHNGARINNLFMDGAPGLLKIFGSIIKFRKPILENLEPLSDTIVKLKADTAQYKDTPEEYTLTATVLEAFDDRVVYMGSFCYDEFADESPVRDKKHTTVCKPDEEYLLPIELIKKQLHERA